MGREKWVVGGGGGAAAEAPKGAQLLPDHAQVVASRL